LVFFLIKLTGDRSLMGEFVNNPFQKWFAIACTAVIVLASAFTVFAVFFA
jgi:Mn2+/Fe2+ NRAMP family transporter